VLYVGLYVQPLSVKFCSAHKHNGAFRFGNRLHTKNLFVQGGSSFGYDRFTRMPTKLYMSADDNPYYKGMDAYQILGVSRDADKKTIKAAYRKGTRRLQSYRAEASIVNPLPSM
jgi:hypothetical protein